jgi:uncharacterized protein
MPRSGCLAGLVLLALLAIPGASGADVSIPPVARVTDLTGTLSTEQQRTLSGRLADFEHEKGSQLAVLVVPSTKPETIEQYGIRVGEAWKLGRKGVDDGVILIVAKNDHRLRIEVGYGLEGAIPDAVAMRIIDEAITPAFKAGDFYAGINAGVDRIMRAARSEGAGSSGPQDGTANDAAADDPAAEQAAREQLERQNAEFDEAQKQLEAMEKDQDHTIYLIMGFFAFLMISIIGIGVIVGVRKGKRSGGGGSSGSGSDSSSSSSSSSSSDDSFSGDGGGFGGGGASGSW